MRYELLLLPSFHSGRLSGWIRLRFLPGRPADLSVHDRLPDGRLLMIGTIGKRCTCRDDNLCPAADAFIHSKLLVYCPVLRHRLPPKSRASVHSHKHVHPARTGLPLKPRRIFTRPINVHGPPEGGWFQWIPGKLRHRNPRCHPVRRLASSHGVIVNARLSVASLSAHRQSMRRQNSRRTSFTLESVTSSQPRRLKSSASWRTTMDIFGRVNLRLGPEW